MQKSGRGGRKTPPRVSPTSMRPSALLCCILVAIVGLCYSHVTPSTAGFVPSTQPVSRRQRGLNGWFGGGGEKKGGSDSTPPAKPQGKAQGPCKVCSDRGYTDCATCKGTGIDKKDGNPFERFKCKKCQGFGLINCAACNPTGLTPEQRGER